MAIDVRELSTRILDPAIAEELDIYERTVGEYLDEFRARTGADELIVTHQAPSVEARLGSVRLLAEAMSPVLA